MNTTLWAIMLIHRLNININLSEINLYNIKYQLNFKI